MTEPAPRDDDIEALKKAAAQFEIYKQLTDAAAAAIMVIEPARGEQPAWTRPMGIVITGGR